MLMNEEIIIDSYMHTDVTRLHVTLLGLMFALHLLH
jgi:hypothetical protein